MRHKCTCHEDDESRATESRGVCRPKKNKKKRPPRRVCLFRLPNTVHLPLAYQMGVLSDWWACTYYHLTVEEPILLTFAEVEFRDVFMFLSHKGETRSAHTFGFSNTSDAPQDLPIQLFYSQSKLALFAEV